jgi:Arc/MetJ-type ribon-helix-helix transcriptional regulator
MWWLIAWSVEPMSYIFPTELQQLVQNELATGNYADEDEVLLQAMRALREREAAREQWCAEIQSRIDSLDRGEGIELADEQSLRALAEEIKAEGRRAYEASGNSP